MTPDQLAKAIEEEARPVPARKRKSAEPTHQCAAVGCEKQVATRLLMCFPHWNRVPRVIQKAVWATAVIQGSEYLNARQAAIEAVARKEGKL